MLLLLLVSRIKDHLLQNPKHETRNTKQKRGERSDVQRFEVLKIRIYFGFRIYLAVIVDEFPHR